MGMAERLRKGFELMQTAKEHPRRIYAILILAYFLLGIFYVFFGAVNNDEGWYLYTSRLVYEGKIPFIDFSYTQPPLLPYIYGIPQMFFGPSLYVGRLTSLLFGILALIFLAKTAENISGKKGAIVALALISFNPFVAFFFTIVKTYALSAFFIVLSLYFLFGANLKNPVKNMLSIFFMGLAVGVRLSVLPALFLLVFYAIYAGRNRLRAAIAGAVSGLAISGFPFILLFSINKDNFMFNLVGYHLARSESMSPLKILFSRLNAFFGSVDMFFAIMVLVLGGGFVLFLSKRKYSAVSGQKALFLYAVLLSVFVFHLAQKPTYSEYNVIIAPVAAILGGYLFKTMCGSMKDGFARAGFAAIIMFMVLLTPLTQGPVGIDLNGSSPMQGIISMSDYIRNNTPEDGKLLLFSTYAAVEADRKVLPGFEMSLFSYYPDWDNDKAEKYRVVNRYLLNRYIAEKSADAILLTDHEMERLQIGNDIINLIEENYYLAKTMEKWGQWSDTAYLYLPKRRA